MRLGRRWCGVGIRGWGGEAHTMSSRKTATRTVIATHWIGVLVAAAYFFGYAPVEAALLALFYGNGMGGLLAHHVRAMGWDEDES